MIGMQQQHMPTMQQPIMTNPLEQKLTLSTGENNATTSKNINVEFFVDDVIIGVQANSNMPINKLIRNFKVKLCSDTIKIIKYIIYPSNIELDPNSTEPISSKGINGKTKINVITRYT